MFRITNSSDEVSRFRGFEVPPRNPATPQPRNPQSGFTLAGLLVILTIISIFIAYTVPRQWSIAMKRDRERQTIFIMKQYARSIAAWQIAHGGLPTSLDQLKEARSPRLLRGVKAEYVDPMTGEIDWILVPPQVAQQGTPGTPGPSNVPRSAWERPENRGATTATSTSANQNEAANPSSPTGQAASPKDYRGPFVGVRPNITGPSYLALNGADQYENWMYTINDLKAEIERYNAGLTMMSQWK